jgi:hypothetical protein
MLVAFRSGEAAMLSLAIKSLTDDEQFNKTSSWVSELSKRYGDPQWISAGKVTKEGVVHATSLIYDLGGGISVVLQSTELELSLTQADFGKIEFGRVVMPYDTLKKKIQKLEQVKVEPAFKDHLKILIEASTQEKLKIRNDVQPSPIKLHLPLSRDTTSHHREVTPSPPNSGPSSTTLWLLFPMVCLGAVGLIWLLLKSRK